MNASPSKSRNRRPGRSIVTARTGPSPLMIGAIVLIVLFAGAVGFGIYRSERHANGPLVFPAGGDAAGVTIGKMSAPVTIDVYVDLQCPLCQRFEHDAGPAIDGFLASGRAKVKYHPMAFLDRMSSTDYSSRASNSTGCAADAGVFPVYLKLLFANQPPEGGDGLTDEQLIEYGRQAGAGPAFAGCLQDRRYAAWTKSVTDIASQANVNGTPTVLVDGRKVESTTAALTDAVHTAR